MDIMLRTPFLAVRCPVFVSPEKYSSVLLGDVAYRAANPLSTGEVYLSMSLQANNLL